MPTFFGAIAEALCSNYSMITLPALDECKPYIAQVVIT
jgi:hypothetical protein